MLVRVEPPPSPQDRIDMRLNRDVLPGVRRDEPLRLVVDLAEQPDLVAISREVERGRGQPSREERKRRTWEELGRACAASQRDLRAFLGTRPNARDVVGFRCVSRVALVGDEALIRELVERDDVVKVWGSELGVTSPPPPDPPDRRTGTATPWAARAIRADAAWGRGERGRGVRVALMDSGQPQRSELLAGRLASCGRFGDRAGDASPSALDEGAGHGTAVLGAAVADRGIGIAPEAEWTQANPIVAGRLDPETLAAAVDWLLRVGLPDVVIVPWDMPDEMPAHAVALPFGALRVAGAAVVFPAGNSGPVQGVNYPPANIEGLAPDGANAFSVGAVDEALEPYAYSCRGPNARDGELFPRIAAPGVALAVPTEGGAGLRPAHGTSFAAGVAGGAAALVMAARPELSGWQVERMLQATARDLGPEGGDSTFGYGLLDVTTALEAAAPDR